MDARDLTLAAVDGFGSRLASVGGRWSNATPCDEWDVRALAGHVVAEWTLWTPSLLEGKTIEEVGDRFEGDVLGDDPVAAWDAAAGLAAAAISDASLDSTVHLSFGDFPASEYLMLVFSDLLVHSWDLDQALGNDAPLDPELVAACASWFADVEELYRAAGAVGPRPDIPADADDQTQLLAAFGRSA